MNTYIQRTKAAILDYLGKAQQTERKISEGRKIYQPDAMDQEEKRLRGELQKERKIVQDRIDSIYQEAAETTRKWFELDGSRLTDDAYLLQGQGVTPDQFDKLVQKNKDNYTMLDQLKKYGETKNAEAAQAAAKTGALMVRNPYNVKTIPDPDERLREWDVMKQTATRFLNIADGTGFNSDFEREFAANTAQKAFETWGEEPEAPEKMTQEAVVDAFTKAWGLENR